MSVAFFKKKNLIISLLSLIPESSEITRKMARQGGSVTERVSEHGVYHIQINKLFVALSV